MVVDVVLVEVVVDVDTVVLEEVDEEEEDEDDVLVVDSVGGNVCGTGGGAGGGVVAGGTVGVGTGTVVGAGVVGGDVEGGEVAGGDVVLVPPSWADAAVAAKPEPEHDDQDGRGESGPSDASGGTRAGGHGRVGNAIGPTPLPGRRGGAQRWCSGQEYVVRPPIVRRSSAVPSSGQCPSRCRSDWRSPVCDPPRRPNSSRVAAIDAAKAAVSSGSRPPASRAGSSPTRQSTSSTRRFPNPATRA